jgi:hypothetical protein
MIGGLIVSVLVRHEESKLVSVSPVVLGGVGAVLLFAPLIAGHVAASARWFMLGALLGLALPNSAGAARAAVLTHAVGNTSRDYLIAVLEQLDDDPNNIVGHVITVSGSWQAPTPTAAATVSRRVMTCCAADAVDVGFDVFPAARVNIADGAEVSATGIARALLHKGETRYALVDARVIVLSEENNGGK